MESKISMRISIFHYLSLSYHSQATDGHPFEPSVYFKVIILMEIGDIKIYSDMSSKTDGVLVPNQ